MISYPHVLYYCTAGASACCNHIIAALYKIDYAQTRGYCNPACTSVPCGWNKSTKREIEGKRVSQICVCKKLCSNIEKKGDAESHREQIRSEALANFDPRISAHRTLTNEHVSSLLNRLHMCSPDAVLFKSVEEAHIPVNRACVSLLDLSANMSDKDPAQKT